MSLILGVLVKLTSRGPALFVQERVGQNGKIFRILKFRTMVHVRKTRHHEVTTKKNQRFTPIGPFLRRWKLDEIPQLFNVLKGEMSLVGPRPLLPSHTKRMIPCRPGLTSAATLAFVHEEEFLARIPHQHLDHFYHTQVLPAKHRLDADYLARATYLSDLKLILTTIARRWDDSFLNQLVDSYLQQIAASAPDTARGEAPTPPAEKPVRSVQYTQFQGLPGSAMPPSRDAQTAD